MKMTSNQTSQMDIMVMMVLNDLNLKMAFSVESAPSSNNLHVQSDSIELQRNDKFKGSVIQQIDQMINYIKSRAQKKPTRSSRFNIGCK